jgi:hypothetical protein
MTNLVKHHKVVSSLPVVLEASSVYYVRVGTGFTQYITNSTGTVVAYKQVIDGQEFTNIILDDINSRVGADHIHIKVKATQAITKGMVLKVVGFNSGENAYEVAQYSSNRDIAFGVAYANIAIGAFGPAINTGLIEGINTSGFEEGDILYPSSSGLTIDRPFNLHYQEIAYVLKAANNGSIFVEVTAPVVKSWIELASQFTIEPFLVNQTTQNSILGEVYQYNFDGNTYYRFVPKTYNAFHDSFYLNYSGGTLTNKIAQRG